MLVSIVMPTYNSGSYIVDAIDSVINQTVKDWELIIVDDCSTDNTQKILNPYISTYDNIHYIKLLHNSGPAIARTVAIKYAKGKYIAFLDSDDLWNTKKLEKQIKFMELTGAKFSCTAYDCMNSFGKSLHFALYPPRKINYSKCIRLSNPIGNLTAMYNQNALGKFVVPSIKKRNDFALWLQILKKTQYCFGMQEVLGTYRMGRKGSVSSNKLRQGKFHWQLYREIEHHGKVKSFFELFYWAFVKGTGIGLDKRKLR